MTAPLNPIINETAAREYAKVAGITAGAILGTAVVLSVVGAGIAEILGYSAAWTAAGILGTGISFSALVAWDIIATARYMLVEQIAAQVARHEAESEKTKAEATLRLSEAGRNDAEAEAIRLGAANAVQFNLNTGKGTQKISTSTLVNKPVTYRVNGKAVIGNQFIQVNQSETPRKIEIPAADVVRIFEQLPVIGHTRDVWLGQKLPYSGVEVNYLIYKAIIIAPLLTDKNPAIVGRGPRASGDLVVTEPKALVKYVESAYPGALTKGITLEIPAKTSGS